MQGEPDIAVERAARPALPALSIAGDPRGHRVLKRAIDVIAAPAGLIALAPVLAIVGAAIRVRLGRPVLFRQARSGYKGKPFTLLKFRTMTDARDGKGNLLPAEQRLTPLGRLLRSLSIDELPQLWNVLKGEMSLVGPRPLPAEWLGRYTTSQARRHEVKPGITGWAQINGRNVLTWEQKFTLDVWYIENRSLLLDARILWQTIMYLVRRGPASHAETAIVEEFKGAVAVPGEFRPESPRAA